MMRNRVHHKVEGLLLIGPTGKCRLLNPWERFLYRIGWRFADDYDTGESVPAVLEELTNKLDFQSEGNDYWQLWVPTARDRGAPTPILMERLDHPEYSTFESFREHHSKPIVQPMWERHEILFKYIATHLSVINVFYMSGRPGYNMQIYVCGRDRTGQLMGVTVGATESEARPIYT